MIQRYRYTTSSQHSLANNAQGSRSNSKMLYSILAMLANADVIAKGLYNSVTEYKFIVFTHFLCDILGDLAYLSRFFQQDNSQVQSAVEGTILITLGQLTSTVKLIIWEESTCILEMTNPLIFEDHELRKSSSDEQHCYTSMHSFADAIV